MKKPTPLYLFVVLIALGIAGFAFFVIFVNLGSFGFILPIIIVFGMVAFFMYIAKAMNTAQFEEKKQVRTICYKCNEEISLSSDYCPKCGANLHDEIECDFCGHKNPIDVDVCQNCNANLK